jgi:hypothetical protein
MKMTLPYERSRSVIQTGAFLKNICINYPTADDIKTIGRLEEFLLRPSDDEKREILINLHMPLFSSEI